MTRTRTGREVNRNGGSAQPAARRGSSQARADRSQRAANANPRPVAQGEQPRSDLNETNSSHGGRSQRILEPQHAERSEQRRPELDSEAIEAMVRARVAEHVENLFGSSDRQVCYYELKLAG